MLRLRYQGTTGAQLETWIANIREAVRKAQAAEVAHRVQVARDKLQQSWKDCPAVVYSKIDPQVISPIFVLQTNDGRFTGNSIEFAQILFNAWLPIFDKYSSQPEPSWDIFRRRFGTYFSPPVAMELRPFTSSGLRGPFSIR